MLSCEDTFQPKSKGHQRTFNLHIIAFTVVKDVVNMTAWRSRLGMGQRESSLSQQSWCWICHADPAVLSFVFRSLPQELLENKPNLSIAKLDCSCQFQKMFHDKQSQTFLTFQISNSTLIILLIHFFTTSECPSPQTSALFRKRSSHFACWQKPCGIALWAARTPFERYFAISQHDLADQELHGCIHTFKVVELSRYSSLQQSTTW